MWTRRYMADNNVTPNEAAIAALVEVKRADKSFGNMAIDFLRTRPELTPNEAARALLKLYP